MKSFRGFLLLWWTAVFGRMCTTGECRETISLDGQVWTATNANKSITVAGCQVPGGIYTDLQRSRAIGDPYFRFNDVEYRWVARDEWTYSREFSVSASVLKHRQVVLRCDGLDTVSVVYVNGKVAGKSSNMFVAYEFDVKDLLQEGSNSVRVEFESPIAYAAREYKAYLREKGYAVPPICPVPVQRGECHANFIRKIQSQFSWDWGPAFPSVGIWKSMKIEAFDYAVIREVTVFTEKDGSGENERRRMRRQEPVERVWRVDATVYLENVDGQNETGQLQVFLDSKQVAQQPVQVVANPARETTVLVSFEVPQVDVKTWWPNGFGEQPLYNLTVTYSNSAAAREASPPSSTKSIRIGFRTVELVQENISNVTEGLSFYFRVNGVAIFMKGSNWIPADSFPERVTPEYTRRLLQSARDAHMNVLRVWGGGMYETDVFYQLADELGIMIWQDLMFACAMYPAKEEFLASVTTEVTQQVQRLQHHPSILLWSGNNENEVALVQNWYFTNSKSVIFRADYIKLYIDTIMPVVSQLDTSRPFLPSSPSNGVDSQREGWLATNPQSDLFGDVHFYVYSGDTWNNISLYPTPRFISEYGFQSWSSFETLSGVSVPEDWSYTSKFTLHRQHHLFGNLEMLAGVMNYFTLPLDCENSVEPSCSSSRADTFAATIYLTQIFQAMSIKTETEHYLRHRSEVNLNSGHTMGALYWQLNDIWQCPSWASIEYGGKWKLLHYFAVHFFSPVLVSPLESDGKLLVYVVSNAATPETQLELTASVYQWKTQKPIYSTSKQFAQPPGVSQRVLEVDMDGFLTSAHCAGRNYCFLYFTLTKNATEVISTNFLLLSPFKTAVGLQQANVQVKVLPPVSPERGTSDTTFDLELTSDAVAPFVWLEAPGIPGRFSDNGFLMVSPQRKVQFHPWYNVSAETLSKQVRVQSLMDIYRT